MKKLFIAVSMFLAFAGVTTAQTAPVKTETKSTTVKTEKKLKKDGTPDKRYKENKTSETVHLKKDGTVDKRYKESKKTTTTTTNQ